MNESVLTVVLLITIIACVSLASIVVLQNKKIKELTTPKYGFLGKSLALAFAFSFIAVGGSFAVGFNSSSRNPNNSVSVSTDEVYLKIETQVIDELNNIYKLNVIPVVNNANWKGQSNLLFNFIWEVNGYQKYIKAEKEISLNNSGGIIVKLKDGKNEVIVQTNYMGNEIIHKEIIEVE